MTKQVFRIFCNVLQNKKTEISHLHKYSDPLLSTLLKRLWQRLQPPVFLAMTLPAWHTCIWGVSLSVSPEMFDRVQVRAQAGPLKDILSGGRGS